MLERKTGENIRNVILEVQQLFGLQNRTIHAVTDAGANVKLACRLAGIGNHLCLGHGLHNLILKDGLQQNGRIYEVVQKATKIIGALRYRASELEEEMDKINRQVICDIEEAGNVLEFDEMYPLPQIDDDTTSPDELQAWNHSYNEDDGGAVYYTGQPKPTPTIKTFTVTRWHALLHMLKSLGTNRAGINAILGRMDKHDLMLTVYEWALLEEVVKFLEPFEVCYQSYTFNCK